MGETPKKKQVMMFSATMTADTRALCKKFMQDPHEIRVDEESKLTLHGLLQYYAKLAEKEKNRKLNDLLDALEFNQVVIFVSHCLGQVACGVQRPFHSNPLQLRAEGAHRSLQAVQIVPEAHHGVVSFVWPGY